MSSPCLSGSSTYMLDLERVKSTRASQASSSSSALTESRNSPLAVSTRKPRAPRKRPNQIYNEAATILSIAYPNVFSIKHLHNASKILNPYAIADSLLLRDASDSLLPFGAFDDSVFLGRHHREDRDISLISTREKCSCNSSCSSSATTTTATLSTINCEADSLEACRGLGVEASDFSAETMLDEEVEEGIEGIFGKMSVSNDQFVNDFRIKALLSCWDYVYRCPNPIGLRLGGRSHLGMRTAFRRRNYSNSLNSPIVEVLDIFPQPNLDSNLRSKNKLKPATTKGGTRKKTKTVKKKQEIGLSSPLGLNLNYDDVLTAGSDRGLLVRGDVGDRLAQIDLFLGKKGTGDASVSLFDAKQRSCSLPKKIRYQVCKVNTERRSRMKGRFARNVNSGSLRKEPPVSSFES